MKRRIFSFLMALVMVLSILPMPVLAADGLCEHHPAHTADCGYAAPVEGQPCSHEGKCSADTCGYVPAQPGVPCGHQHDETCGWSAGKDEVPCDKGCAEVDENGVIIHVEGCAYAPAVAETACSHQCSLEVCGYVAPIEGVKCGHEHDGTCGYVQAVAGAACGFVCTQCAQQSDPDQGEASCTCDVPCNEMVNADCPVCSVSTEGCKGKAAEDAPTCNCQNKCTAETVKTDCPVCGAENADLNGCIGKAAPICDCADQCTADAIKADCPVCGGENADLTNCIGTPAPAVTENAKAVQSLIDALPTLEAVQAMTMEEQGNIYNQTQAAYGAYEKLTEEEKTTVNGAEIFETLLTYFATLTAPTVDNEAKIGDTEYATLQDAFNACTGNETVKLLTDVSLTADLTIPAVVTLEVPANLTLTVPNGVTLTNNGTIAGSGTITGTGTFTRGAKGKYNLKVTRNLPTQADEAMNVVKTPYGVVVQSLLGPDWGRPQYKKGTDGTLQNSPIFPYENGESVDSINYYMQITEDGEIFKVPNASNNNVSNNPSGDGTERYNGTLTPGTTYYFNLSGQGIPGNPNSSLPDSTMNWVPFTFVGDVFAYALDSSSSGNTEASELAAAGKGFGSAKMRSLFIAEKALTTSANWSTLNGSGLIFGTPVESGGISYTLRAPSAGSGKIEESSLLKCVTPGINEWNAIRQKLEWSDGTSTNFFVGQDTYSSGSTYCMGRTESGGADAISKSTATHYRPVLELPSDASLKVVTVDLNNGKIGNSNETSVKVVMAADSTAYPDGSTLTAPEGKVFDKWQESEDGATITAQWKNDTGPFTVTGGEYGEDYEWNGADGVKKLTILKDTQLTISTPNNNKDNLAQAYISSGSDNAVNLILDGVHITANGCSGTSSALVAASNLTINLAANSTNTLRGPDSAGASSAISSLGNLTITGSGTLDAIGGDATGTDAPSSGLSADGGITINGGNVTAIGGSVPATGDASCGMKGNVTINGGTGKAEGKTSAVSSTATVTLGPGMAKVEEEDGKTIKWGPAVNIATQPTAQTVTVGETATFTVAAENGPLTYQWQSSSNGTDWTNVSGATSASYITEATTIAMSGTQYRCVVSNEYGSVTSNPATLTVADYVAKFGETSYFTFGDAVAALNTSENGGTIELLKDVELSGEVAVNKNVTLVIPNTVSLSGYATGHLTIGENCELKVDGMLECPVVMKTGANIANGIFDNTVSGYDEDTTYFIQNGTFYQQASGATITGGAFKFNPELGNTIPDDYDVTEPDENLFYHVFHVNHTVTTWTANEETATISGPCTVCGEPLWATLTAPKDAVYTGSPITATVEKSTNWVGDEPTVTYTNNTNAGTATATMTMGGQSVSVTYTIAPKTVTVTIAPLEFVYDGTVQKPTVTAKDGETDIPDTEYTVTIKQGNTVVTAPTDAGTYTMTVTDASDGNYTLSETSADFTISKANPAPTVPTGLTATYGDTLASVALPDGWTWADGTTSVGNAGEQKFTATFTPADTDNYNTVTANVMVTVNKKPVTVTAQAKSKVYGEDDPALTYTANGLLGNDTITGTLTRAEGENVGSYAINQGNLTAGDNYTISFTGATFTITPAPLTIRANDQTITYGEKIATGLDQVTVTGLVNNETLTAITLTPSDTDATDNGTITPSAAQLSGSLDNYNVTYTNGKLVINKAAPTYTAPAAKSLTFSNGPQELVEAGSTAHGTILYKLDGDWTEEVPTATNAGTYTVYWKLTGDRNHTNVAEQNITVTINPKEVTATIAPLEFVYNGSVQKPTVTVKDGKTDIPDTAYTVTIKQGETEVTAPTEAGTYTVEVTDNEGGNYSVSGSATFTIHPSGTVIPEGTVTTHLTADGDVKVDFTYGDTIIVKAKPQLTNQKPSGLAALFSFLVPQEKEMAVFYDGKQVSDPVKADAEGWYIMEADTTLIGANPTEPLTVQFKGSANQGDAAQTVVVTIAQKEITVTGVKAVDRPYEPGNTTVSLDLSNGDIEGVLKVDENDVNLYAGTVGTVESAAAGTGKTVSFNPFTLIGNKAANYTVKEQPKLTVNISKLDVTVTADSFNVVVGDTMPTLTYKVTGLVEGEPLPEGMVKLGCDANLNKVGEYPITASGDSTYGNYNISYVNGKLTVQEKFVPVTGVTLNEKLTLDEGKKETLNAIIAPANATNKKVTWKSSDETVATVDANGTVTAKAAGTAIITVTTEDGGFEAKCEITVKKTFTVTFDSNGGTPAPKDQTVVKNGKVTKPADPAKKDKNGKALKFGGWFKDKDFKEEWNFAEDKVTGNVTLYAQWLYTYKVDFRDNTSAHVSNMPDDIETHSPEDTLKIRIPANKPKRSGYYFAGWYKSYDHSGTRYNPGDDLSMNGNTEVILYARWKEVDPTNAKTGDYIMIAVAVLAVSGAALAGLLVYSKKKKK